MWLVAGLSLFWLLVRVTGTDRWVPAQQVVPFTPYASPAALLFAVLGVAVGGAAAVAGWVLAGTAVGWALCLVPRLRGRRITATPDPHELRVGTLNALHGQADLDALAAFVADYRIDVLVVQE